MRHPYLIAALALAALAGSSLAAAAQIAGPTVSPATPPFSPSISTGINTSGVNQPGVPNTSTPGLIGTDAAPSGLPGDSRSHPGFPGHVGARSH